MVCMNNQINNSGYRVCGIRLRSWVLMHELILHKAIENQDHLNTEVTKCRSVTVKESDCPLLLLDCKSIQLKTVSVLWESSATICFPLPSLQAFPVVFWKPLYKEFNQLLSGVYLFQLYNLILFFLVVSQKLQYVTIIKNKLFFLTADSLQPTLVLEELGAASPNLIHGVSTDLNTQLCGAQTLRYTAAKHRKPLNKWQNSN